VVLDANVLVPPGLRDLLLSCADVAVFRPVWQTRIEAEVHRNGVRLAKRKGASDQEAIAQLDHALAQMNLAFPDARLDDKQWQHHVEDMTNHPKDRHVLAAAVGGGATHVVTANIRDFPVRSRPPGVRVQKPDAFLLDRLAERPELVVYGVQRMAARHRRPSETPEALALRMVQSEHVRRFAQALLEVLSPQEVAPPRW
jgi:predicted nucleic acid-binding protein